MYPLNLGRLFFHSRVFFHGFATNRSRRLRAVAYLCVGRGRADRAPRLAARHSRTHCNANKHC